MTTAFKKSKRRKELLDLHTELQITKAQQVHRLSFASQAIEKMNTTNYRGSALIITIQGLSGNEVTEPFGISDGLSDETIAALQMDILRTYHKVTEFKPRNYAETRKQFLEKEYLNIRGDHEGDTCSRILNESFGKIEFCDGVLVLDEATKVVYCPKCGM